MTMSSPTTPDPWPSAGGGPSTAPPARPAPRLGPDESIARLFTRTGRFARIDPTRPGRWPSWPQVAGTAAWAAFTVGCGVVAWRRHRER